MSAAKIRLAIGLALILTVCLATAGRGDGTQTGVLAGQVTDSQGMPLPGVEVILFGPQRESKSASDDDGRFRFPALPVADYRVKADLLGLVAEQETRVFIDATTTVELRLAEPTTATPAAPAVGGEHIQVVAVAPLLDRFETRIGASVTRELLEELPIERFYQSVALLLPGVVGGEDGNPNVSGALRDSNLFLVDGVDTTDATTGLFGLNIGYEAVQEVRAITAAAPVGLGRVSGAVIDVVTRSGGNDFHGSGRWVVGDSKLDADYTDPSPVVELEIAAANSESGDLASEIAATLGGPLQPDHLWFFAAFADEESDLLRPTRSGERWEEDTSLTTTSLKLNWQGAARHSLAGQYIADEAIFTAFGLFDTAPGENGVGQAPKPLLDSIGDRLPGDIFALQALSQDGELAQLRWHSALHRNASLSATAATQERRLERRSRNRRGLAADAPHFAYTVTMVEPLPDGSELVTEVLSLFNGILEEGFEERKREQANLTTELFLRQGAAEHELRFGLDYQRTRSRTALQLPGLDVTDPITGRPVTGQLFFDDDLSDACFFDGECEQGFDPETGTFLPTHLLNFWRRPARQTRMETFALHLQDSLSLGRWLISLGLRFESVTGRDEGGRKLVEDEVLAPRLGLKFDPKGDGRALLAASFARFYEPFPQAFLDDFLVNDFFSGYTEYDWGELLGLDCSGQDPTDPTDPCWQLFEVVPFSPVQLANPNLSLDRAYVDELVVSFEKQLTANTAFRLSWIQRDWHDLWDDLLEEEGDQLVATVENLPAARRSYRGLHLLVQKRFTQRWRLLGSYSWSETEGNLFQQTGLATFADFSDRTNLNLVNRYGPAPYDSTYQLKTHASYRQPLGWADLIVGTVLHFADGTPFQRQQEEDLGTRFLTARGSSELDDVFQWDLSLALAVPLFRETDLWLKLEAFNLTDEQTRIGVDTDIDFDFGEPRSLADLQQPRRFRLTVGFSF